MLSKHVQSKMADGDAAKVIAFLYQFHFLPYRQI